MQRRSGNAFFNSLISSTPLLPGSLISTIAISGGRFIICGSASSADAQLEITSKFFELRIKTSSADLKCGSSSIIETVVKALFYRIQDTYLSMNACRVKKRDFIHGTGSYPLPPQGWQREILLIANHIPLNTPCFFNASAA